MVSRSFKAIALHVRRNCCSRFDKERELVKKDDNLVFCIRNHELWGNINQGIGCWGKDGFWLTDDKRIDLDYQQENVDDQGNIHPEGYPPALAKVNLQVRPGVLSGSVQDYLEQVYYVW